VGIDSAPAAPVARGVKADSLKSERSPNVAAPLESLPCRKASKPKFSSAASPSLKG
jgi:hypothetical protein